MSRESNYLPPFVQPPPTDDGGLICPQCGYNLTGLTVDRCPECGRPSAVSDAAIVAANRRYPALKRATWISAIVIFFGSSILDITHPSRALSLATGIAIAVLASYWAWIDSIEHRGRLTTAERALIILLTPLGLFLYLARQRRGQSILWLFGLALTMLFAASVGIAVGNRIVFGVWPSALW